MSGTLAFYRFFIFWITYRWIKVAIYTIEAASWRKRLDARLPPLGSRVRVSVPPCGFRGGRNGVWVVFSRGFSRFPLPQISLHHFSTLISSISLHFISPCDGASGVVGRHPCDHGPTISGLHRISSLDPTLCWTRVEDIFIIISPIFLLFLIKIINSLLILV